MEKIAVIGLGYVGLPVATAFAKIHDSVVAYDISSERVDELRGGLDRNGDVSSDILIDHKEVFTSEAGKLSYSTFYVVAVPTPIDKDCKPDLGPLTSACEVIGQYLVKGDLVVLESTVYPGVTEEVCAPI